MSVNENKIIKCCFSDVLSVCLVKMVKREHLGGRHCCVWCLVTPAAV